MHGRAPSISRRTAIYSTLLQIVFWLAALGLATPLIIYPISLYGLSRLRRPKSAGSATPTATLVISAYNEAEVIGEKITNALASRYDRERLEVMVISDASSDETDDIVQGFSEENVQLCRQEFRFGKSAGLSRFCPEAAGDILIFTDANAIFQKDAIAKLLRHFDDPQVGYTVGRQVYHREENQSARSENTYWSMELILKEWESRLSSVVGADGAIYALRKELFEPLVAEDINDFLLPLKVVAAGYRGVFDPEAECYEWAAPSFQGEFRRKYRIVNRSLRAVLKVPKTLSPFHVGWFAYQLWAHKVLRWLSPAFLLILFVTSALLALGGSFWYGLALGAQLAGYGCAGLYAIPALRRWKLCYLAYYFLLVNCAAAIGILLLLSGKTIGTWNPQR